MHTRIHRSQNAYLTILERIYVTVCVCVCVCVCVYVARFLANVLSKINKFSTNRIVCCTQPDNLQKVNEHRVHYVYMLATFQLLKAKNGLGFRSCQGPCWVQVNIVEKKAPPHKTA